jgi:hypothetical protein
MIKILFCLYLLFGFGWSIRSSYALLQVRCLSLGNLLGDFILTVIFWPIEVFSIKIGPFEK